jgi:hypothetical protein
MRRLMPRKGAIDIRAFAYALGALVFAIVGGAMISLALSVSAGIGKIQQEIDTLFRELRLTNSTSTSG